MPKLGTKQQQTIVTTEKSEADHQQVAGNLQFIADNVSSENLQWLRDLLGRRDANDALDKLKNLANNPMAASLLKNM